MSAQPTTYQPKGGMCMTCQHKDRDCSALPFHNMPMIRLDVFVCIVRCTEHVKVVKS